MERKIIENLINSIKHRTEEINNDIDLLQSLINSNENMKDKYKTEVSQEERNLFSVQEDKIHLTNEPPRTGYIPSSTGYYGNLKEIYKSVLRMGVNDYLFVAETVSIINRAMNRHGDISEEVVNEIKNSKIARRLNKYLSAGDYLYISLLTSNALKKITRRGDVPLKFVNMINDPLSEEAMEMYLYYNYKIENKYRIKLPTQLTLKERTGILNLCKESYSDVTSVKIYHAKSILERIIDNK